MSELANSILARASKPSKGVPKVVAVRIQNESYAVLAEQASLAGVKPSNLVQAMIETFVADIQADGVAKS